MEKVDIVIGAVGFVAIVATVLGVVFFEELAGEENFTVGMDTVMPDAQTGGISGNPTEFTFDLPNNATHMKIMVQLRCDSGQAIDPATATFTAETMGPGANDTTPPTTGSANIPAGQTCSGQNIGAPLELDVMLSEAPTNVTGTKESVVEEYTIDYTNQTVTVMVSGSAQGTAPGIPVGPAGNFGLSVEVTAEIHTFFLALETPDVETA